MNNLDKGFYPTNKNMCGELVEGLVYFEYQSILEPSAGKGHIVDFLKSWGKTIKYDIDCIELDKERKAILKEKGYNVVFDNFLEYETSKKYDLIIMNPPFNEGAKHLLHAISLQEKFGGRIRCLLNAETIRNPFSNERKILIQKLKDYNANIRFVSDAFMTSETERKTSVDVAIIDVEIIGSLNRQNFNEDKMKKNIIDEDIEEEQKDSIMAKENLQQKIERYEQEVESCRNWYESYTNEIQKFSIVKVVLNKNSQRYCTGTNWNNILREINKKYWEELFLIDEFTDKLTYDQRSKWTNRIEDLQNYEFSLYNINEIKGEILKNAYKGLEDMAFKLFDRFTSEYYTEGCNNIHYYNGWKTNKAYIVGSKVKSVIHIYDGYSYSSWYCSFESVDILNSVDKVLDLFNAGEIEWKGDSCGDIVREACKKAHDKEDDSLVKNIETKYAFIDCYKKNTIDFKFKEDAMEIIKRFNIFGGKKKGWLPQTFGSFRYDEANKEEKEVVDSFYSKFYEGSSKVFRKNDAGKVVQSKKNITKDISKEYEKDISCKKEINLLN